MRFAHSQSSVSGPCRWSISEQTRILSGKGRGYDRDATRLSFFGTAKSRPNQCVRKRRDDGRDNATWWAPDICLARMEKFRMKSRTSIFSSYG